MSFTLFTSDHFTPQLICGASGLPDAAACLVKFRASSPAARDFPASLLAMERLLFIALLQRIADPMQLN